MAQTGKNVAVRFMEESSFNVEPSGTAEELRVTPSPGLSLARAQIDSEEVRDDLLTTMARMGSREVTGSYTGELSVDSFDTILEAIMRSSWVAAVEITETEMTSITTTTSTIVAAAGSWITEGVRVGDIVVLTNHSTAANNNINLQVTGVTASTITVAGTPLTADASADSDFELTILRKLSNGTTPTRRTFHFEEYMQDIDLSETFGGCRIIRVRISGQPDGMAQIEIGVLGASVTTNDTGTAPVFTSPTEYTTVGLVFTDASIYFDGALATALTSFELTLEINASTLPVIGSNDTPDVFDNEMRVTGSISGLREDLDHVDDLDDESELELHVLLEEPESDPKDCVAIFVPRLKLTGAEAPLGGDGAMVETMPFVAGLKESATGYDQTMLTISTTAS